MSEPSHKKIVRADSGSRKKAVIIFAGALIVGLVLLHYFRTFLQGIENLIDESPQEAINRLLTAFGVVMAAMVFGFAAFALYLWRISLRTFRSEQFPPPGIHVTRDSDMITGQGAKLRGMMGLVIAASMAAFGLLLALYVYRMIQNLMIPVVGADGL